MSGTPGKTVIPLSVHSNGNPRTVLERRATPGARGITCDGLSVRISTHPSRRVIHRNVLQKEILLAIISEQRIFLSSLLRYSTATG